MSSTNSKVTMHVYDDIQEEDNQLPNWWLFILFGTVVFSFGYWFVYHTVKSLPNPPAVYAADVTQFQKDHPPGEMTDEGLVLFAKDPANVEEGKKVFLATCASCHGQAAQGIVGPNLTDKYWIHGAKPSDIATSVTNGYAEKGMPAWGKPLGQDKVKKVVVFVMSLKGTSLPPDVKAKDPQGDLVE